MKGAAEKAVIATALSSFFHMSARVPPTSVIGALKAMPSIARQTMSVAMFCETAQGMTKMTAKPIVRRYNGFLPNNSEQGANASGPTPTPATNTVIVSRATS